MLRAQFSYRLVGLIERVSPGGFAAKLVKLLGLKIPVTPRSLAATLMKTSGGFLNDLEKRLEEFNNEHPDAKIFVSQRCAAAIAVELLCALSWLALSILSRDDFARDQELFGTYALETFEELEKLLDDGTTVVLFKQVGQETRELYLFDKPSLRELAAAGGEVVLGLFREVIDMAEREPNWLGIYLFKARMRIAARLPVDPRSIYYMEFSMFFGIAIQTSAELFEELRPVSASS